MKIRSVGAEFHAAGQTDRHDEANSRFSNFADAPKNCRYSSNTLLDLCTFFARLCPFLPLLKDIFRSAVQLPCNLYLNFRRGLEMPTFADKFDAGEEKIVARGGRGQVNWVGDEIVLKRFRHTFYRREPLTQRHSVTSRRNNSFETLPDFRLHILNILWGSLST